MDLCPADLANLSDYEHELTQFSYTLYSELHCSQLSARQLAERLFLRKLKKSFFDNNPVVDRKTFHISNAQSLSVGGSFLGAGVNYNKEMVRQLDIPRDLNFVDLTDDKQFDDFTLAVHTYFNATLSPFQKTLLLRYLYGRAYAMLQHTKQHAQFIVGRRNIAFRYIHHVIDKLGADFEELDGMRIQIHEVVGKSGIGKSNAVFELRFLLHAIMPIIPCENMVYSRANDYWWNGYEGQPIVLYDDFTHSLKKMKFDLHYELISVASGTMRKPPMAFVKDMPFTSSMVYVTSNVPVLTTVHVEATLSALKRRIISLTYKPLRNTFDFGNCRYRFKGALSNIIVSGKRNIFSTISETIRIIEEKATYEIQEYGEIDIFSDFQVEKLKQRYHAFCKKLHDLKLKESADSIPEPPVANLQVTYRIDPEFEENDNVGSVLSYMAVTGPPPFHACYEDRNHQLIPCWSKAGDGGVCQCMPCPQSADAYSVCLDVKDHHGGPHDWRPGASPSPPRQEEQEMHPAISRCRLM